MITPRTDLSPSSDLIVTQINIIPVASGHNSTGQPFDFAANPSKLVRQQVDVEIIELDELENETVKAGQEPAQGG